jgi:hypothetical protein
MSTIPGGMKKPISNFENPLYPDIRQDPLKFSFSRKFWQVDVGEALKSSEKYGMFQENAVTFESRNRNETKYGKSSHRDYVNLEVRYPLISPYDLLPLSRQPRRPVAPYVNPGLAGGAWNLQVTQDVFNNAPFGYITDRITYTSTLPLKILSEMYRDNNKYDDSSLFNNPSISS